MTSARDALPIATNKTLCLASASPRRLDLLAQVGVIPQKVLTPAINEEPLPRETPRECAKRLAYEKAHHIFSQGEADFVLAADTVVGVGRRHLPKAETAEQAEECLRLLSGRAHRVHSGVCLLGEELCALKVITTRVTFKRLDEHEIKTYLKSKEWCDKAGGYAIQGLAESFVRQIQGSYSNIVGLPLFETMALLRGAGYLR